MKRILFLVSTLKRSGPINVLIGIIKHLDRNKFIPIVLTLSPESHDSLWDYFKDDLKVEVSSLNLSRLQGLFKSKKLLKRFLDNNSIDLIHSHGIRADSCINFA